MLGKTRWCNDPSSIIKLNIVVYAKKLTSTPERLPYFQISSAQPSTKVVHPSAMASLRLLSVELSLGYRSDGKYLLPV